MKMTNGEIPMTKEFQMTGWSSSFSLRVSVAARGSKLKLELQPGFVIRASSFFRHWDFGIRHSFFCFLCCATSFAADAPSPLKSVLPSDVSFRNEIQRAIDRGLAWLQSKQDTNGFWQTADHP